MKPKVPKTSKEPKEPLIQNGVISTTKETPLGPIILRRTINPSTSIPQKDLPQIFFDYVYCMRSAESIAKEYNVPSQTVHKLIKGFQADLNNLTESYALLDTKMIDSSSVRYDPVAQAARRVIITEHINKEFLASLSEEQDPILSDKEHTYAWIYVHTNDNAKALKDSGLDIGLLRTKGTTRENSSYANALKIRGYYLRHKHNVKKFILALREKNLKDLNIDKGFIQTNLVTEIEMMQEEGDPKNKGHMLRALELLGKTIPGTFSETIKVEEVSPDKALDRLIEMAKADINVGKVKTLPKGSQVDYEVKDYEVKDYTLYNEDE